MMDSNSSQKKSIGLPVCKSQTQSKPSWLPEPANDGSDLSINAQVTGP